MHKDLFENYPGYDALPERVVGEITGWTRGANGGRTAGKLNVAWLADKSNSDEYLSVMLRSKYSLRLEKYADGRNVPRAIGFEYKRRYATALRDGPYAGAINHGYAVRGLLQELRVAMVEPTVV